MYLMEPLLPYFLDFEKEVARVKDPERVKAFYSKLAWEMIECGEATEVFPDMLICPICLAHLKDGVMLHKFRSQIFN